MINEVIHQILDLDQRAVRIKESATARAEKIETDTKEELKQEEMHIISAAKEESKNNYDVEINKATSEKEKAIQETAQALKAVREHYEAAKKETARNVLDELFKSI